MSKPDAFRTDPGEKAPARGNIVRGLVSFVISPALTNLVGVGGDANA